MSNSIVATIPFDFKGEHHTPSALIDLDRFIANNHELPNIYSEVASLNQIGLYSYEYEVLMSSEIHFSNAEGLAKAFIDGIHFDFDGFKQHLHEQKSLVALNLIAKEHLQIDDLEQEPALKRALLEACRYGESLSQT
ncbi:MAG: hypothetical protein OQK78_07225 [Gammaproteobacteria bacterium]|nr:hypothetical protein [Gammaproteobacteria bacterium]